jgi:hypothetical protein
VDIGESAGHPWNNAKGDKNVSGWNNAKGDKDVSGRIPGNLAATLIESCGM